LQDLKGKFAEVLGCEYDRNAGISAMSTFHDGLAVWQPDSS